MVESSAKSSVGGLGASIPGAANFGLNASEKYLPFAAVLHPRGHPIFRAVNSSPCRRRAGSFSDFAFHVVFWTNACRCLKVDFVAHAALARCAPFSAVRVLESKRVQSAVFSSASEFLRFDMRQRRNGVRASGRKQLPRSSARNACCSGSSCVPHAIGRQDASRWRLSGVNYPCATGCAFQRERIERRNMAARSRQPSPSCGPVAGSIALPRADQTAFPDRIGNVPLP